MTLYVVSESLRRILPRVEIHARDRRPFAYPVYSKTGDRTRTGRNPVWFDDAATIRFLTGTQVFYPTTAISGSLIAAPDLTGTLGSVVGNVVKANVEQFALFADQSEKPGPFVATGLFEQDETNKVNSTLMTGSAFFVDPLSFRSKISNKTIIRIEIPITANTSFSSTSSSMLYLNTSLGKFDVIATEMYDRGASRGRANLLTPQETSWAVPFEMDPVLFTPYGFLYAPSPDLPGQNAKSQFLSAPDLLPWVTTFVPNGFNKLNPSITLTLPFHTSSLINPGHAPTVSQSVRLSNYLAGPLLLETAVVEFNVAAGPSWMNDVFTMRPFVTDSLQGASATSITDMDCGGPMVTVGLLRHSRIDHADRELIASATFTNALEATTASYLVTTCSMHPNSDGLSYYSTMLNDVVVTRQGLSGTVNPGYVISGTVLSGANNSFTGAVRLVMQPAATGHLFRCRSSGSSTIGFFQNPVGEFGTWDSSYDSSDRTTESLPIAWATPGREPGVYASGRSALGRQLALLSRAQCSTVTSPMARYEPDFENKQALQRTTLGGNTIISSTLKAFVDVATNTNASPYLLRPSDELVITLSKHRACATSMSYQAYGPGGGNALSLHGKALWPSSLQANHDIQVLTGVLRLTLYGDQVRNGVEFHDTLNQRLETAELWQSLGEDPVIDQYDVSLGTDLSGTYVDRFYVIQNRPNAIATVLSASTETTRLFSSFTRSGSYAFAGQGTMTGVDTMDATPWSTQYKWSTNKFAWELKKPNRNVKHISIDEIFWDCRLPDPSEMLFKCNPIFKLYNGVDGSGNVYPNVIATGDGVQIASFTGSTPKYSFPSGALDFAMTYPYEQRYNGVNTRLDLTNQGNYFTAQLLNGGIITNYNLSSIVQYSNMSFEFGDFTTGGTTIRRIRSEATIGVTIPEFIKYFYGIGDGISSVDNQFVFGRADALLDGFHGVEVGADIRGWKYGLHSGFAHRSGAVFRRDRFGQPRDMLEQRLDAKFYDSATQILPGRNKQLPSVGQSPVQVKFYDQKGNVTDPLRTLSSNLSIEATSSVPYTDGLARNRSTIDPSLLNILNVTV